MGKTVEEKTVRNLNIHYRIHVVVVAALLLLAALRVINFSEYAHHVTVVAERYALMFTLLAIPAALKLFSVQLGKIPKNTEPQVAIRAYKKAYFIRLYIIGTAALANIVLYAASHNTNFMWLAVVLLVVYFFCAPSHHEAASLTETLKAEDRDE